MILKELALKLVARLSHEEFGPTEEVMIRVAKLNPEGAVVSVRDVPVRYVITELQPTILIAISEDALERAEVKTRV